MKATETFTFRISPKDREKLYDIAEHLDRSMSSTIKTLIKSFWWEFLKEETLNIPEDNPRTRCRPEDKERGE